MLDDTPISGASIREAAGLASAAIHAFPFTDPVEELLLTEGNDSFVSFREAAELDWSVRLKEMSFLVVIYTL